MVYEYAQELEELGANQFSEVEIQISFVTLFMQYRGEVQLNGKKKWEKTSDWQMEDTESMPKKMMEEIFQLVTWERDGWPKPGKSDSSNEK